MSSSCFSLLTTYRGFAPGRNPQGYSPPTEIFGATTNLVACDCCLKRRRMHNFSHDFRKIWDYVGFATFLHFPRHLQTAFVHFVTGGRSQG